MHISTHPDALARRITVSHWIRVQTANRIFRNGHFAPQRSHQRKAIRAKRGNHELRTTGAGLGASVSTALQFNTNLEDFLLANSPDPRLHPVQSRSRLSKTSLLLFFFRFFFFFSRCQDDDNNDNSLLAALGRLSRWVEHCPVDATPFFLVSLPTRIRTSSRPGLGILRIAPGHRLHLRRTNV
jgi:hypothetical protein